jgi:hypothetical protein
MLKHVNENFRKIKTPINEEFKAKIDLKEQRKLSNDKRQRCHCNEKNEWYGWWRDNLVPDREGSGFLYCRICNKLTSIPEEMLKQNAKECKS